MKPRFGMILFAVVFFGLLLCTSSQGLAASLSLTLPNGPEGATVTAGLGFADSTDVASFTVTLYYPAEGSFFTPGSFSGNSTFMPSVPVGTENANFSLFPGTGVFCVVGLKPTTASGSTAIGTLPFTVSAQAAIGDERVVTLTGQAYMNDGQVVDLVPVSVTFTVNNGTVTAPTATTAAADSVTTTTATLNGTVNPNGAETTIVFEWGVTDGYGNTAPAAQSPLSGNTLQNVSADLTGLLSGTEYHYRVKATNSEGTTYGLDGTFQTSATVPTVTTEPASYVTSTTATLNGTVNPNGAETTIVFEWGVTDGYGNTAPAAQSPLSGNTLQNVSADLTGLLPGTEYHYRVKATNSEGTTYGLDGTFLAPIADISVSQRVDRLDPGVGDDVVLTLTVTNHGPSDVTGLEVEDILPSGLTYISDTSGGTYDHDAGIWNIGYLSAASPHNQVGFELTARMAHKGKVSNIATVKKCDVVEFDRVNNSSAILLNGGVQADLAVVKSADTPVPVLGNTVVFTIKVANNGLVDASGIEISEMLPQGLTYQSSTPSAGVYEPAAGVWSIPDLPSGFSETIVLSARVDSEEEIVNAALIAKCDLIDPDTTNNWASVIVNQNLVDHPAVIDLAIQIIVNENIFTLGNKVVFTIVVRNNGPDDATNVQVDNVLPDAFGFVSSKPSHGTYDDQTGIWDIGKIPAGSYVRMDMVAEVTGGMAQTNTAKVKNVDEFDLNSGNNAASVGPPPDIKVNGTDTPISVSSGASVSVAIGMNPGEYAGFNADWWVAVHTPFAPPGDWYTYVYPAGWMAGVNLCTQTPLFEFSGFEVLDMVLPSGNYTFYFAVDAPDGSVTADLVDSVDVTVE